MLALKLCRAPGVGIPAASKHLLHSKIKIVGEIRERDKGVKYPSPHPPFPGTDPGGTMRYPATVLEISYVEAERWV